MIQPKLCAMVCELLLILFNVVMAHNSCNLAPPRILIGTEDYECWKRVNLVIIADCKEGEFIPDVLESPWVSILAIISNMPFCTMLGNDYFRTAVIVGGENPSFLWDFSSPNATDNSDYTSALYLNGIRTGPTGPFRADLALDLAIKAHVDEHANLATTERHILIISDRAEIDPTAGVAKVREAENQQIKVFFLSVQTPETTAWQLLGCQSQANCPSLLSHPGPAVYPSYYRYCNRICPVNTDAVCNEWDVWSNCTGNCSTDNGLQIRTRKQPLTIKPETHRYFSIPGMTCEEIVTKEETPCQLTDCPSLVPPIKFSGESDIIFIVESASNITNEVYDQFKVLIIKIAQGFIVNFESTHCYILENRTDGSISCNIDMGIATSIDRFSTHVEESSLVGIRHSIDQNIEEAIRTLDNIAQIRPSVSKTMILILSCLSAINENTARMVEAANLKGYGLYIIEVCEDGGLSAASALLGCEEDNTNACKDLTFTTPLDMFRSLPATFVKLFENIQDNHGTPAEVAPKSSSNGENAKSANEKSEENGSSAMVIAIAGGIASVVILLIAGIGTFIFNRTDTPSNIPAPAIDHQPENVQLMRDIPDGPDEEAITVQADHYVG